MKKELTLRELQEAEKKQILLAKEKVIGYYFEKEKFRYTQAVNRNLTSETWAKNISKWAGVKIDNSDVIQFCKKYFILSEEVCKNLYCFGIFK